MARGKFYRAWDGWPYCEPCANRYMGWGFAFPAPVIAETNAVCTACHRAVVAEKSCDCAGVHSCNLAMS